MGLEERIQEEMYVDAESLLEDEFDRAKSLFDIYDDNTVVIADEFADADAKTEILVRLTAQQYVAEANEDVDPAMGYDSFYDRFEKDESTIRSYFRDLVDDGLVEKAEEQGHHQLVVERLPDVLDRVESTTDDE